MFKVRISNRNSFLGYLLKRDSEEHEIFKTKNECERCIESMRKESSPGIKFEIVSV